MVDREVERTTGRCSVTGREFGEGEAFFAVLFEEGDGFRREDFSPEVWKGPPDGAYCHFSSRMPVKQKKKRLFVDDELLSQFFLRLEGDEEPVRVQFRFVLSLILMRKRLLKYEDSGQEDGVETWKMILMQDRSEHRVINPGLSDDQIAGVSEQLSAILHGDTGEWPAEQAEPAPTQVAQVDGEAGPDEN